MSMDHEFGHLSGYFSSQCYKYFTLKVSVRVSVSTKLNCSGLYVSFPPKINLCLEDLIPAWVAMDIWLDQKGLSSSIDKSIAQFIINRLLKMRFKGRSGYVYLKGIFYLCPFTVFLLDDQSWSGLIHHTFLPAYALPHHRPIYSKGVIE